MSILSDLVEFWVKLGIDLYLSVFIYSQIHHASLRKSCIVWLSEFSIQIEKECLLKCMIYKATVSENLRVFLHHLQEAK